MEEMVQKEKKESEVTLDPLVHLEIHWKELQVHRVYLVLLERRGYLEDLVYLEVPVFQEKREI